MIELDEAALFRRLVQKFEPQSTLLRVWKLTGGVSAQVMALEVRRPDGSTRKMVVRRHGPVDLQNNPQVAADEFKLLQILGAAGVSAPTPYYMDQTGEIFPTPYVVIEYVEGATEFAPADLPDFIRQLALHLQRIHSVSPAQFDLSFLPQQQRKYAAKFKERPARMDDSIDEGTIRAALQPVWPLAQHNESALLHGDYWPGNVLWQGGEVAAVIDWEDALIGDPLADLASSRLELLWALGAEAMQLFTNHYRALAKLDYSNLPYWDLVAALRPAFKISEWAASTAEEQKMRELHRSFINAAFRQITGE